MIRSFPTVLLAAALMLMVLSPCRAHATLGEGASSVAKDRRALGAAHRATVSRGSYTVEEETSPSSTVREYINTSGIVFAVAWNGLAPPDYGAILGAYFSEYRDAKKRTARTPGRRSSRVSTDRMVLETWGHMRDLHGRAYLPALLPAGVNADDIQ